jgi:hypothetical protein
MEGAAITTTATVAAAAAYLCPTMIAYARALPGTPRIALLNVLAGWTIAGWVLALSRALSAHSAEPRRPGPGPVQWHTCSAAGLSAPRPGSPPPLPGGPAPGRLRLVREGMPPRGSGPARADRSEGRNS